MNVFVFSGHLGQDATQRFTQGGDSIVSFSVPVKAGFGEKAVITWVKCSLWGKRGESVLPYLLKAQHVAVNGEFSMEKWTTKDGAERTDPVVRVNDVELLGKRTEGSSAPAPSQSKPAPAKNVQGAQGGGGAFSDMEDDIPFQCHGAGRAWSVL